jgi:hypothetical protein
MRSAREGSGTHNYKTRSVCNTPCFLEWKVTRTVTKIKIMQPLVTARFSTMWWLATHHGGACGERRYSSYSFTTSALDGAEWSASRPGRALPPGKGPPVYTQCTGGWVGPRAGLDTEASGKILCPRRRSNPDRPVVQSVVRHYTDWATRLLMVGRGRKTLINSMEQRSNLEGD